MRKGASTFATCDWEKKEGGVDLSFPETSCFMKRRPTHCGDDDIAQVTTRKAGKPRHPPSQLFQAGLRRANCDQGELRQAVQSKMAAKTYHPHHRHNQSQLTVHY
jgi:hypothetical protein